MPPRDKFPQKPILCYVTDRKSLPAKTAGAETPVDTAEAENFISLLDRIKRATQSGIDWIQIREKDLNARDYSKLVRAVLAQNSSIARSPLLPPDSASTRILVNDRLDLAIAEQAAGVHLGEHSLPIGEVTAWLLRRSQANRSDYSLLNPRSVPKKKFLVGISCHSLASAQLASQSGADYIFFGPIFATPSKAAYGPPQGLDRLSQVCRVLSVPVLAIGGVTYKNAASCIASGAAGVSGIRLFQENSNIDALVNELHSMSVVPQ